MRGSLNNLKLAIAYYCFVRCYPRRKLGKRQNSCLITSKTKSGGNNPLHLRLVIREGLELKNKKLCSSEFLTISELLFLSCTSYNLINSIFVDPFYRPLVKVNFTKINRISWWAMKQLLSGFESELKVHIANTVFYSTWFHFVRESSVSYYKHTCTLRDHLFLGCVRVQM